ncbi:kelch repeat and BTB domain-containing protein 7-like [Lissotriton helveticus]
MSCRSVSSYFSGPEEKVDGGHAAAVLTQLKNFYDSRALCDVTIEVLGGMASPTAATPTTAAGARSPSVEATGRLFSCNRNVLAAACPYFKSMFTGGLCESKQKKVTLHNMDAESMALIIDYCYTGRVTVSEANVQRLYAAADMLQLEYVRQVCAGSLARRLEPANCAGILKFADAFDHAELRAQALAYVARHFSQLSGGELCELSLAQLQEVLRLDDLDVDWERRVCAAALQWLEAAPADRGPCAAEVLRCVRWHHLADKDRVYLEELRGRPFVQRYCLPYLQGVLDDRYGPVCPPTPPEPQTPPQESPARRIGMQAKEMVIFIFIIDFRNPFRCWDPYSGDIYTMPPLATAVHESDKTVSTWRVCVSPQHDIYLLLQPLKQLWVYNPVRGSWRQLAETLLCRFDMDLAYLRGHIYILGGTDPITEANSREVECYSVQRDQWALVSPLPHSMCFFDLVTVGDNLYAVSHKRLLCYDPNRDKWTNCASVGDSHFQGVCVFKDEIYCICSLPVVNVYSPARGEWRRVCDIPEVVNMRSYLLVCHGGRLLLITYNSLHCQSDVLTAQFQYDAFADRWLKVGVKVGLLSPQCGLTCLSARVFTSCLKPRQSITREPYDENSN